MARAQTKTSLRNWPPSRFLAVRIALLYFVAGSLWIYLSGLLLHQLVEDREMARYLETAKGWLFVLVTTFLLAAILHRYLQRIRDSARELMRSEEELKRLNRLYAALTEVNQAIPRTSSRDELFRTVTEVLVKTGGFSTVWIGWRQRDTSKVDVLAIYGEYAHEVGAVQVYADQRPEGQGPTGTAIRTGKPDICNDMRTAERLAPWREALTKVPLRSAAAFPIAVYGKPRGALVVYEKEPEFFQEREAALLQTAAEDIGFALEHLENDQRRRAAEEQALRWQRVFERAAFGLAYARSSDNTLIAVNEAFARERGYAPFELTGKPLLDLYPPETRHQMANRLVELERSGCLVFETTHMRKDGSRFPVLMEITTFKDAEGMPESLIAYALDISRLRETEQALAKTALRLEIAATAGNIGLWDWHIDTQKVYFSKEWKGQLGFAEKEIPDDYAEWEKRLHPDERESVVAQVQRFVKGDSPLYHIEFRLRHKDGSYRWILARASILRHSNGEPYAMLGSHTDVTENRRREEFLEGQRQVLEKIATGASMESTLEALCRVLEKHSPELLCAILLMQPNGRCRHGGAGSLPREFTSALDGEVVTAEAGSCGAAAVRGEQVITKDIGTDPLWRNYRELAAKFGLRSCWSTPVKANTGEVLATFAIYRRSPGVPNQEELDLVHTATSIAAICITRQRDEAALRESEQRLRFALEGANEGIWDLEPGSNKAYLSPRACSILGYSPEEFASTGKSWEDLVHRGDMGAAFAALRAHIDEKLPAFAVEQRLRTRTGDWKWVLARGKVIEHGPEGQPVRITGTLSDITDRKQMEEALHELSTRLMQAQDVERRRIARELHDTTAQNLTALSLNLSRLKAMGGLPEQGLDICNRSMELASQATREIRTLSYLLHPPLLETSGLLDAVEDYAEGISERADITISVVAQKPFQRLPEDLELALFRVVQESLTNVVRHSGSTRATVRLKRTPDEIMVEIRDYGAGIPTDKLRRIHQRSGGSGVGLGGMRERMRLVGGHFEIDSGPEGTTVRAVVPLAVPAKRQ